MLPVRRCIAFLLLLTVLGVVAIIVVRIINPNRRRVVEGASAIVNSTVNAVNGTSVGNAAIAGTTSVVSQGVNSVNNTLGRRSLLMASIRHLLELNATL